jgi:hypothetical protein
MRRLVLAASVVLAVGLGARAARAADDPASPPPPPPQWVADRACCAADVAAQPCCRCLTVVGPSWTQGQEYFPVVPINESRSAFTAFAPPPSAFVGSEGDAGTPCRGSVSIHIERLSDERVLTDNLGNVYSSDGEVQLTTLEWVSRRFTLPGVCRYVPFHVGVSLTGYSLHGAAFDWLRNFVENDILGSTPEVRAGHDIGGRELNVTTPAGDQTDFLSAWPLLKVKGFVKFPLHEVRLGCTRLRSALSVGITTPAFGNHSDSGNSSFQPEAAFAFSLPFYNHLRWTGAACVAWAGGTDEFQRLGLRHEDWVLSGETNLEYWFSWRWALAAGVSWNSAYLRDSGLPMDLSSVYVNIGLLYRLGPCSDLHLMFSENPENQINTLPGSDYHASQKDADFTLALGWRLAL